MMAPSPTKPDKPQNMASAVTHHLHFQMKWFKAAQWVEMFMLFYLFGPVIFSARRLQQKASAQFWQTSHRWAIVQRTAFLSLLWYIPLMFFRTPLTAFWAAPFLAVSRMLHFPALAMFGAIALFPPTPMNMLFRWFLALPLASLLACFFELIQPLTSKSLRRVLTLEEQAQLANSRTKQSEKMTPAKKAGVLPGANISKSATRHKKTAIAQDRSQELSLSPQTDSQEKARQQRETRIIIPATSTNRSANAPTPSAHRYTWDEGEGMIDS
jgi:hypothetical protein